MLRSSNLVFAFVLILIQAWGCNAKRIDDETGIDACDRYLSTISHCMGNTPTSMSTARESLQSQIKSAHGDEVALKILKEQCLDGERSAEKVCR